MSTLTRRTFLGSSTLAGAALALPGCSGRSVAKNDTIGLGFVGLRGRGNDLLGAFRKVPGVRVVALCDVDPAVLQQRLAQSKALGEQPFTTSDAQELFASKAVDAVVIATPNHTHTVLAVRALRAGKDVYVEKPVSHTYAEGQALVAAARRSDRIVAAGLQNRSDTALVPAFAELHRGAFGKVQAIHGICFRDRKGIGKRATPLGPPASLDYDKWLGPAEDLPILRDSFHYDWHWVWNTGDGDIGNQGPHELDLACWALGDPGLPSEVQALGGRYVWDDAGETPNLLVARFAFGAVPLSFVVRNPIPKQKSVHHGLDSTGIVVFTDRGELRAQRGGAVFVDPAGKEVQRWKGDSGATHQANFVAAVRARDRAALRCEVATGERSAALAHLANASYRSGEPRVCDAKERQELADSLALLEPHFRAQGLDPQTTPSRIGTRLVRSGEHFTGNAFLRRARRPGWEV